MEFFQNGIKSKRKTSNEFFIISFEHGGTVDKNNAVTTARNKNKMKETEQTTRTESKNSLPKRPW